MANIKIEIPITKEFYDAALDDEQEYYVYNANLQEIIDDNINFIDYFDDEQIREEFFARGLKIEKEEEEEIKTNLYDDLKKELLDEAFNLYSLEELQILLHWKQGEGIKKFKIRRF